MWGLLPGYPPWPRCFEKQSLWSQRAWLPWEMGRWRTGRWSAGRTCLTTGYLATYRHFLNRTQSLTPWNLMYNSQLHHFQEASRYQLVCTAHLNQVVLWLESDLSTLCMFLSGKYMKHLSISWFAQHTWIESSSVWSLIHQYYSGVWFISIIHVFVCKIYEASQYQLVYTMHLFLLFCTVNSFYWFVVFANNIHYTIYEPQTIFMLENKCVWINVCFS